MDTTLWVILLIAVVCAAIYYGIKILVKISKPQADEVRNTFKFRTILFLALGLLIPFWIVTLPVFWYLAYQSYIAGPQTAGSGVSGAPFTFGLQPVAAPAAAPAPAPVSAFGDRASQIAALHELLKSGALTQEEFDEQKRRVLAGEA